MSQVIKAQVDGVTVTLREAQKVAKYLMSHRKEYKTSEDVQLAFVAFIRKLRGDSNAQA